MSHTFSAGQVILPTFIDMLLYPREILLYITIVTDISYLDELLV